MAVLVNYPRVSCSKWFVLKSQHGCVWWEEPGMLKAWEAAAWTTAGAGPGCDLQHGRITLAFGLCGDSPCKQSALWKPLFHPCSPGGQEKLVLGSVHPGTSLQQLPACQLLTVPDIPDLLQWHRCPSLLQKGLLFTVFLYKIWSCLVVTTEWLGSAGSPKFSSLFGHRLQLCAYIL